MGSEADSKHERHMSATQVSFEKKSETGVKARGQTEKITFSEIVTSGHEGTVHTDLASETGIAVIADVESHTAVILLNCVNSTQHTWSTR